MTKEYYVRKVFHGSYGELYQFLTLNAETGKEEVVHPFEMKAFPELVEEEIPEVLCITSKRGADASGCHKGDKFVVKKGSKFAASTSPKCPKRYVKLREGLILDKLLIPLHGQLLLMEDVEFESPMTAMGVAIGGWVKGPHDWKGTKKK